MKKPHLLIPLVFFASPWITLAEEMSVGEKIGHSARQVTTFFGNLYDNVTNTVTENGQKIENKANETGQTLSEMHDEVMYDARDRYSQFEYDVRKGYAGE